MGKTLKATYLNFPKITTPLHKDKDLEQFIIKSNLNTRKIIAEMEKLLNTKNVDMQTHQLGKWDVTIPPNYRSMETKEFLENVDDGPLGHLARSAIREHANKWVRMGKELNFKTEPRHLTF
jgi:hypothetical protein